MSLAIYEGNSDSSSNLDSSDEDEYARDTSRISAPVGHEVVFLPNGTYTFIESAYKSSYPSTSKTSSDEGGKNWRLDRKANKDILQYKTLYRLDIPNYELSISIGRKISSDNIAKLSHSLPSGAVESTKHKKSSNYSFEYSTERTKALRSVHITDILDKGKRYFSLSVSALIASLDLQRLSKEKLKALKSRKLSEGNKLEKQSLLLTFSTAASIASSSFIPLQPNAEITADDNECLSSEIEVNFFHHL
jgi:hypothetical protein